MNTTIRGGARHAVERNSECLVHPHRARHGPRVMAAVARAAAWRIAGCGDGFPPTHAGRRAIRVIRAP